MRHYHHIARDELSIVSPRAHHIRLSNTTYIEIDAHFSRSGVTAEYPGAKYFIITAGAYCRRRTYLANASITSTDIATTTPARAADAIRVIGVPPQLVSDNTTLHAATSALPGANTHDRVRFHRHIFIHGWRAWRLLARNIISTAQAITSSATSADTSKLRAQTGTASFQFGRATAPAHARLPPARLPVSRSFIRRVLAHHGRVIDTSPEFCRYTDILQLPELVTQSTYAPTEPTRSL
jgi:hypothetical protein